MRPKRSDRRPNRVERFFSRVGMVVAALAFVVLVIGLDLFLTEEVGPLDPNVGGFEMRMIAADGRELGWKGPQAKVLLVHTPFTFYENLPNQERHEINSIGLRGPEVSPAPDRSRIVVIGGSAAYGLGLEGRDTLSSALGLLNGDIEVLNAGVVGYHTSQELELVVHKLLDLQPSLIVAFNGWNDLFESVWWPRFGDADVEFSAPGVFKQLETRLLKYREVEWNPRYAMLELGFSIVRNTTLLSALYRRVVVGRGPLQPRAVTRAVDAESLERAVEHYVSNMKKLNGLAGSVGARLLVVLQPEQGQLISLAVMEARYRGKRGGWPEPWYWGIFPAQYLSFRNRVVPALERAGVNIVDASALMTDRKQAKSSFLDAVHLSPVGNALLARLLDDSVRKLIQTPADRAHLLRNRPDERSSPCHSARHALGNHDSPCGKEHPLGGDN